MLVSTHACGLRRLILKEVEGLHLTYRASSHPWEKERILEVVELGFDERILI